MTLKGLLRRGLVAEVLAGSDDVEWYLSEEGERLTLAIAEVSLAAIGL